jgi:RecA/RadA recombinase
LSQSALVKVLPSHALFHFNISNIDNLFPGFLDGDFAVIYGAFTVLPLSLLLTVRAQLPFQLGGLESNVVFVDGGNSFRLYDVSRIAQAHQLDPKHVLKRIYISRAFTAYQMTSIILEKLKETVQRFESKFVIISDIASLYLDEDMPGNEAKEIFSHLATYLASFAEENQLIIMATCLPHYSSKQGVFFHSALFGRANVVISVRPSKHGQVFVLEKHPMFSLGHAEFPSENFTLDRFMEEGLE